eukprot:476840_1
MKLILCLSLIIYYVSGDELGRSWMKYIPDTANLHELNIPGTHETGAIIEGRGTGSSKYAQCQSMTVKQQLEIGIRALDLRVYPVESSPDFLKIYHCTISMHSTYGKPASAAGKAKQSADYQPSQLDIEGQIESFLQANPEECVIIKMKNECAGTKSVGGCAPKIEQALQTIISNKPSLYLTFLTKIAEESHLPSIPLSQCRGKIVLFLEYLSTSFANFYVLPAEIGIWNREKREQYWDGKAWVDVRYGLPWTNDAATLRKDSWTQRMDETVNGNIQTKHFIQRKDKPSANYVYTRDRYPHFIQNSINANSAGKASISAAPVGYTGSGTPLDWNIIFKPFVAGYIFRKCYTRYRVVDPQHSYHLPINLRGTQPKLGIIGMDFADNLSYMIFLTNNEWWHGTIGLSEKEHSYRLRGNAQRILGEFRNGIFGGHILSCPKIRYCDFQRCEPEIVETEPDKLIEFTFKRNEMDDIVRELTASTFTSNVFSVNGNMEFVRNEIIAILIVMVLCIGCFCGIIMGCIGMRIVSNLMWTKKSNDEQLYVD